MYLENIEHKTSLLLIIVFFKETFNINDKTDVIFIDFIKSVGIEEDNQILAIEFYNRYRSDVLTDLLY